MKTSYEDTAATPYKATEKNLFSASKTTSYRVQFVGVLLLGRLHGGGQQLVPFVVFIELSQSLPGLQIGGFEVVRWVQLGLLLIYNTEKQITSGFEA